MRHRKFLPIKNMDQRLIFGVSVWICTRCCLANFHLKSNIEVAILPNSMLVFSKAAKSPIRFPKVDSFHCSSMEGFSDLDCQDLLTRLLEPSPAKRISMQEILRHPFLISQLGPIELIPYKPHADVKEINKNIIRYLAFKSVPSSSSSSIGFFFLFVDIANQNMKSKKLFCIESPLQLVHFIPWLNDACKKVSVGPIELTIIPPPECHRLQPPAQQRPMAYPMMLFSIDSIATNLYYLVDVTTRPQQYQPMRIKCPEKNRTMPSMNKFYCARIPARAASQLVWLKRRWMN